MPHFISPALQNRTFIAQRSTRYFRSASENEARNSARLVTRLSIVLPENISHGWHKDYRTMRTWLDFIPCV